MEHTKNHEVCDDMLNNEVITEYCVLCGNIIKDKPARVKITEQGKKYFCSEQCYKKYKKFCKGVE